MTRRLKALARTLLAASPLPMLARRAHRRHLSILMLHGFTTGTVEAYENLDHKHLELPKWEAFAAWLARWYRVIPLSEAVSALQRGTSLPDHALCLTMDDGFRSTHDLALPVLQRYQLPASVYLATAFVHEKRPVWVDRVSYALVKSGRSLADLRRIKGALKQQPQDEIEKAVAALEAETGHAMPASVDDPSLPATQRSLDWDQIAAMRATGLVEFGSHTHDHRLLGRCSEAVARQELQRSRMLIEEHTGAPCDLFCYPNGQPGDYTDMSERLVREVGYTCSLTTVGGWNAANASPYAMRRLGVNNELDLPRFKLAISGFQAWKEGGWPQ